jgi:hypothetical protein
LPSPTPTPTFLPTQTASGLVIITHQIVGEPALDPLNFVTVQGETYTYQDMGQGEFFTFNWNETFPMGMWLMLGDDKLMASEYYSSDGLQGWVTLTRNGQEIYHIDTGKGSPISAIQGLWTYDDRWVLETNHYEDDHPFNGKITQDGVVLNDRYGYDEAFGFQTIKGRPLYFFKQDGEIDAWYDGKIIRLGYEDIPHYGCCSSGELNPHLWTEMVAFFGIRSGTWYFVQIGTPDSFVP